MQVEVKSEYVEEAKKLGNLLMELEELSGKHISLKKLTASAQMYIIDRADFAKYESLESPIKIGPDLLTILFALNSFSEVDVEKHETLRPVLQQFRNNVDELTSKVLSGDWVSYAYLKTFSAWRDIGRVKNSLKRIGKELAVPIRGRMINYESGILEGFRREIGENLAVDADPFPNLGIMPMYRYSNGLVLDSEHWLDGKTGKPMLVYKTGGRTISFFDGTKIIQQKGGGLRRMFMGVSNASDQNMGVLTSANAHMDHDNVKIIGEENLHYSVELYDLGEVKLDASNLFLWQVMWKRWYEIGQIKPLKEGSKVSLDLSILERKADTRENNLHLRLSPVIGVYETSPKLKRFFDSIGVNLVKSVTTAGRMLRLAHERGVFPLNYHLGNFSMDGYPVDFEGAPNNTNLDEYMKGKVNGRALEGLKVRGLYWILAGLTKLPNYTSALEYTRSLTSGYTHLSDASGLVSEAEFKGALESRKDAIKLTTKIVKATA